MHVGVTEVLAARDVGTPRLIIGDAGVYLRWQQNRQG